MKEGCVGFIGLGAMGASMVENLIKGGYRVLGYDLSVERQSVVSSIGGEIAGEISEVVEKAFVVFTSLPSSEIFVEVAERNFTSNARSEQVFIDLGTVLPREARRVSKLISDAGASFLDAPVTGGVGGAKEGMLSIFIGGDEAVFEKCRPLLGAIGNPDRLTYCGESGSGQILKGVNQLANGLGFAAMVETISYGVNCGLSLESLEAVGGSNSWRKLYSNILDVVKRGDGKGIGVKSGQMNYFLDEAREKGFSMPLAAALGEYLKDSEKVVMEANRMSPSYWSELVKSRSIECE